MSAPPLVPPIAASAAACSASWAAPVGAASCCADFYSDPAVQALLGDHFHPGGAALTDRCIADLELRPGARVLDLACGVGTAAVRIAELHEVEVVGVDAAAGNVDRARGRAARAGRAGRVSFEVAEAGALPFADGALDAVLCECAVSTFEDQAGALAEVARVLGRGGRFSMSDMAVSGPLPDDLAGVLAPWTCVAGARDVAGYQRLLLDAGLHVTACADESAALLEMTVELKRKLLLAGLSAASGLLPALGMDLATARELLGRARAFVDQGVVGYLRITAARGLALPGPVERPAAPNRPAPSVPRPALPTSSSTDGCDPKGGCCR